MSQFVKSILNYYAAFTETRFSNKSTLNYKWLDDANLTLDLSFFTDFFRAWIVKLSRFEKISSNPVIPDFDNISLDSLTALYQRRHDIPRILDARNTINNQAIDQGAAANINTASLRNIGECKSPENRGTDKARRAKFASGAGFRSMNISPLNLPQPLPASP